ncbi:MAG: cell division protein SepF [Clostridia bacterium]|nr:cell division protein SepF [Clostridia bacterium]
MGLWESFKNIMTIPDEDDYDEEVAETVAGEEKKKSYDDSFSAKTSESPRLIKSKAGSSSRAAAPQLQVVLVKPDRFEDVTSIADHLNEKKTVVLNLEAANRDVSRRIIDFLSGVAYANHGNIRKVANSTFIIVAHDVDVMGELMLDDYEEGKLYF